MVRNDAYFDVVVDYGTIHYNVYDTFNLFWTSPFTVSGVSVRFYASWIKRALESGFTGGCCGNGWLDLWY